MAELRLDVAASSVSAARSFVRSHVVALGGDESAQDRAALLVSELVTNAVLHARTQALVSVELTAGDVLAFMIAVADGSAARVRQRRYGPQESTGRGLRLVESLSAEWGVEPSQAISAAGKSVWFRLLAHCEDIDDGREADLALDLFDVEAYEDSV